MNKEVSILDEVIVNKIYIIRGHKVMLDKDLAALFGIENKQLKRQVRRNINRFPESFMFELTKKELLLLRNHIGTLQQKQHFRHPPFVFTEYGILMLSNILNSKIAVNMSVQIIETFVQLRKLANNDEDILNKIEKMESQYNNQFNEIDTVIKKLLSEPEEKQRSKIGYKKE